MPRELPCAHPEAAVQPLAHLLWRLQELYAIQLLLETVIQLLLEIVDVLENLFDTVAVSVDLILESLKRWKPKQCTHRLPSAPGCSTEGSGRA